MFPCDFLSGSAPRIERKPIIAQGSDKKRVVKYIVHVVSDRAPILPYEIPENEHEHHQAAADKRPAGKKPESRKHPQNHFNERQHGEESVHGPHGKKGIGKGRALRRNPRVEPGYQAHGPVEKNVYAKRDPKNRIGQIQIIVPSRHDLPPHRGFRSAPRHETRAHGIHSPKPWHPTRGDDAQKTRVIIQFGALSRGR